MKSHRISELIYWVIFGISVYQVASLWDANQSKAYLYIGFAVLSLFMALFRRSYRKKIGRGSNDS